jgi:hypothetical protein
VTQERFASDESSDDVSDMVDQLCGWDTKTLKQRYRVSGKKLADGEETHLGSVVRLGTALLTQNGERKTKLVLREMATGQPIRAFLLQQVHYLAGGQALEGGRALLQIQEDEVGSLRWVLLDPGTGRILHEIRDPAGFRTSAATRDGQWAVRTNGARLEVYDPTSGEVRARFFADQRLREAAFNPEGTLLFVGDQAGFVHVLELPSAV